MTPEQEQAMWEFVVAEAALVLNKYGAGKDDARTAAAKVVVAIAGETEKAPSIEERARAAATQTGYPVQTHRQWIAEETAPPTPNLGTVPRTDGTNGGQE